ncbi:MAG: chain-length determining protein [Planctomycetaceae bacterium]|nr:MAG: chain-length determining protein [Planctomycetaceae bacterium]
MVGEHEFLPHHWPAVSAASPAADEAPRISPNYVLLLWQYRWWLLLGATCGLLGGFAAYWKLGPEYEASAQILVSRRQAVPLKEEQRTLNDWGDRSEHIALMMSPMIVGKAVALGKLDQLPSFRGSPDIIEDILDSLKVKRNSGQDRSLINLLTVSYVHRHPDEARAVVQAVIEAYAHYLEETRDEKSNEALRLARQAHDEVLAKLREKEQEYQRFREQAPLQWRTAVPGVASESQPATNMHQERLLALEDQRRQVLIRQTELRARQAAVQHAQQQRRASRDALEVMIRHFLNHDSGAAIEQRRQQELSIFEARLLPLLLDEQKLLRDYGPDHPDVMQIRQTISTVLEQYRARGVELQADSSRWTAPDFVALYLAALDQELAELTLRERELTRLIEQEAEQLKQVARYQSQEQSLQAEIQRLRDLWSQLALQVNQVSIERQGAGYSLRQLAPIKHALALKRLLKIVGAGTIFGTGFVLVAIFCWVWRDQRVQSPAQVRQLLRQPVLGSVGEFSRQYDDPEMQRVHPALRFLRAPHSPEAEQFRALRAAIAMLKDQRQLKRLQITSAEPGDGKTTTAVNLGLACAQAGIKTLLIDADLRRPMCHRLFGISGDVGLVDVLQGELQPCHAPRATQLPNLSILPAGKPPQNPSELLSLPAWHETLHALDSEFDLLIIDSPPLLAVSDPCLTARDVEGLLLVVKVGKNTSPALSQVRQLCETYQLPVLGVVINGISTPAHTYYYTYSERPTSHEVLVEQPA